MIPRLAPANNEFTTTITVNKRLRPYFEKWFQAERLEGESPPEFVVRKLKSSALQDYLVGTLPTQTAIISAAKAAEEDALRDDINLLTTEVG